MNFDLTRSSLFATMFYSIVLLVIFWGTGSIVAPQTHGQINPDPFMVSAWSDALILKYPTVARILSAAVVFICSVMVARLAVRNVIYMERTYMPSMLFVIISSAFYSSVESLTPLCVAFLMIKALRLIFRSFHIKHLACGVYLIAGLYFGLSAFIYPPSAYIVLMLFTGLGAFRVSKLREWLAAGVGFLLPMAMFCYILWLTGGDVKDQILRFWGELNWHGDVEGFVDRLKVVDYAFAATLFLMICCSIITFIRSNKNYKLKSRLTYYYLLSFGMWSMVVASISPASSIYMLPILAVPVSVIIPVYFASRKPSFMSNFLFAMLIFSSIALHLIDTLL